MRLKPLKTSDFLPATFLGLVCRLPEESITLMAIPFGLGLMMILYDHALKKEVVLVEEGLDYTEAAEHLIKMLEAYNRHAKTD